MTKAYQWTTDDNEMADNAVIVSIGGAEWTKSEDGGKDPWRLQLPSGAPISFAGIWPHNDNLGVTSCTIITAPVSPEIAHI